MGCNRIKKELHQFIDRQVSVKQEEKILEHLKQCESCRVYYKMLQNYKSYVKSPLLNDLSPFPEIEIKEEKKRYKKEFFLGIAAVFTGIFLGFSIFSLYFHQQTAYQNIKYSSQEYRYQYPMSFMLYSNDFFMTEEVASDSIFFSFDED